MLETFSKGVVYFCMVGWGIVFSLITLYFTVLFISVAKEEVLNHIKKYRNTKRNSYDTRSRPC